MWVKFLLKEKQQQQQQQQTAPSGNQTWISTLELNSRDWHEKMAADFYATQNAP